ncbi:unnamed protein product, partial [Ectocarpus sp. 12 AP-2014]
KDRWWCSSGARCSESNLEFHRHPFENDLEKCHDFVLKTGIKLCLVHASREEADNETRRVLNVQKKENHLASAMARGGDERRAGAGGAASEVAAASTRTTVASTDVAATAPPEEDVGDAVATAGRLGAGEGEGSAKDSSGDEGDGRDKVGTTEPGQDGELGSAASPASSTRNRNERSGKREGGPRDSGDDDVDDDRAGGGKLATPAAAGSSTHQQASSSTIELCSMRSTAAAKIQSLVRMFQAYKRYERARNDAWTANRGGSRARRRARNALKNANHPVAAMGQGGAIVGGGAVDQAAVAVDQAVVGDVAVDQAAVGDLGGEAGAASSRNEAVAVDNAAMVRQGAAVGDVATKPEQEDKGADAPPRVGGTSRTNNASVARRTTGAVVAKARSPKSPLPAVRAQDRRSEALAFDGVEDGGKAAGPGGGASRRGVQVQEGSQTRLRGDHWKERRRGLPIGINRKGTQGLAPRVGLGASSKWCKHGADGGPGEDDPELPARKALAGAVGTHSPSTEAEYRQVIRIGVRAVASAGEGGGVATSADSHRDKLTSRYAFSDEKVRLGRDKAGDFGRQPRCPAHNAVTAGIRQHARTQSEYAQQQARDEATALASAGVRAGSKPGGSVGKPMVATASRCGGRRAGRQVRFRHFLAEHFRQLQAATGYRLLPVARRAINSSITRSCRLLPMAQRAINSTITRSYRLLPVARRLIVRSVTSSRVRLTPVARRATSMANELVWAAARSVRNAVTRIPRDQEPAGAFSNRTLTVPHPSGASPPARPRVTNIVVRHRGPSMCICHWCGRRSTALWNNDKGVYQCHFCPVDWSGGSTVHHRLHADHLPQRLDCNPPRVRRPPPAAAPSTRQAYRPPTFPTGRAAGFRGVLVVAPPSGSLVRRSSPAAAPSTLPTVAPPTAPAGGATVFRGVSVVAAPSADPSPMGVDDPAPAATPAHATGFIFGAISAVGTGIATGSTAPTPMVVDSPTPAAPQPPSARLILTGNQPGPQFTFGGGAASATTAAATTTTAIPPTRVFAINAPRAPARASAGVATVSTAPTPMHVVSPTPAAPQAPSASSTFTGNGARFTFGGGAASATTAAATTTAATTAPFPGPTLTAGGVAPHGPGGGTTSSVLPVPTGFTCGTGGASRGNGVITAPTALAGASASTATASMA